MFCLAFEFATNGEKFCLMRCLQLFKNFQLLVFRLLHFNPQSPLLFLKHDDLLFQVFHPTGTLVVAGFEIAEF